MEYETATQTAEEIKNAIRGGAIARIVTSARITVIDAKVLARFDRAGGWLLKDEGTGYRLQSGKSSVYLFPGQLEITR